MTFAARIAPCWNFEGELEDLADPKTIRVDWRFVAATLAGLPRFGKRHPGMALSVAQHSALGADVINAEHKSPALGALFLLHDAHEYLIGEITTPAMQLISHHLKRRMRGVVAKEDRVERAIADAKADLDAAIYRKAGLPAPTKWSEEHRRLVKEMDTRMFEAEATILYGPGIWDHHPRSGLPSVHPVALHRPWGVEEAALQFGKRLTSYLGIPEWQWRGSR